MTQAAGPLIVVVPPDDLSIVMSSVVGEVVGHVLADAFVDVPFVVSAETAVNAYGAHARPMRPGHSPERSVILLVDGRAWLSPVAIAEILARSEHGTRELLVTHRSERVAGKVTPIAVLLSDRSEEHWRSVSLAETDTLATTLPGLELGSLPHVDVKDLPEAHAVSFLRSYVELSEMEREIVRSRAAEAMVAGVRIVDPDHFWLRGDLRAAAGVRIDVNVVIEGSVVLGAGVEIGANCILRDVTLGAGSQVRPFSLVEGARIGTETRIGPYARIRPGTDVGDRVQIGNYVEIKDSQIGSECRINHHSFIGDALLGPGVTIGAGTITCNHDGQRIQRTEIREHAYIGSGTRLVAPVTVGEYSTIGAGSTITKDVPSRSFALALARQVVLPERGRSDLD